MSLLPPITHSLCSPVMSQSAPQIYAPKGIAVLGGSGQTPKTIHLRLLPHSHRPHSHYEEDQVHFPCLVKRLFILLSKGEGWKERFSVLTYRTSGEGRFCETEDNWVCILSSTELLSCLTFLLARFILLCFISARPDQLYLSARLPFPHYPARQKCLNRWAQQSFGVDLSKLFSDCDKKGALFSPQL